MTESKTKRPSVVPAGVSKYDHVQGNIRTGAPMQGEIPTRDNPTPGDYSNIGRGAYPLNKQKSGGGSVSGESPTVIDNIVAWADALGTSIKDSGIAKASVVLLTAAQSLTNKVINGVTLMSSGNPLLFLNQLGTYTVPGGGGNVIGPASAVSGNATVFDGTTGKIIKDSGIPLSLTAGVDNFLRGDGTYNKPVEYVWVKRVFTVADFEYVPQFGFFWYESRFYSNWKVTDIPTGQTAKSVKRVTAFCSLTPQTAGSVQYTSMGQFQPIPWGFVFGAIPENQPGMGHMRYEKGTVDGNFGGMDQPVFQIPVVKNYLGTYEKMGTIGYKNWAGPQYVTGGAQVNGSFSGFNTIWTAQNTTWAWSLRSPIARISDTANAFELHALTNTQNIMWDSYYYMPTNGSFRVVVSAINPTASVTVWFLCEL